MKSSFSQPVLSDLLPEQRLMSVHENATLFLASVTNLKKESSKGPIEFDKDNDDALNFVTSASNLRSVVFDIPTQSKFDVKSSAGSIIPAIATTNAIIAGLMVIEAYKVLNAKWKACRTIYLQRKPSANRLLLSCFTQPNENCYVCGRRLLLLKANLNKMTLGYFVNKILKERLIFNEPSISVNNDIIYECGEGLEKEEIHRNAIQMKRTLNDVGITHDSLAEIDDNSQDYKLQISLIHCENLLDDKLFEFVGFDQPIEQPEKVSTVFEKQAEMEENTPTTKKRRLEPKEYNADHNIDDEDHHKIEKRAKGSQKETSSPNYENLNTQ